MKTGFAALLHEFHTHPNCDPEQRALRFTLHKEEHKELEHELAAHFRGEPYDRCQMARELADVVYISFGTAHVHSIDLTLAVREVHRAGMRKLEANVRRADGKVLKPPGFVPPDMSAAVLPL